MEREALELLVREATQAVARDPELRREAELLVRERIAAGIEDRETLAAEVAARYTPRLRARRIARGLLTVVLYAILPFCFIISVLGFFSNAQPTDATRDVIPFQLVLQYATNHQNATGLFAYASGNQQRRKLWQTDPGNLAYLNAYAVSTFYFTRADDEDEAATIERDLRRYRQLDPRNAHADYLLAYLQLTRTLREEPLPHKDIDIIEKEYRSNRHIAVQDRQQLDRAMLLVKEGMHKPVWQSYTREIERERLHFISPPYRLIDYRTRAELAYEPGYYHRHSKELVVLSSWYARQLVSEGHPREALPYLNFWRVYCRQLLADADDASDLRICVSLAQTGAKLAAAVYREMGREDLAQQALDDYARLYTQLYGKPPVQPKHGIVPTLYGADPRPATYASLPARYGGNLAEEALSPFVYKPFISYPTKIFTPARNLGYILSEELWLSIFLFFIVGLLGVLFIVQIFWGLAGLRQSAAPPLLLLPPARVWALILGVGIILPLLGYWWFTRYSGWAGRELAVDLYPDRFNKQLLMLQGLLVCLPLLIGWVWIRRRCAALQLPLSFANRNFVSRDVWSGTVALLVAGLCLFAGYYSMFSREDAPEIPLACMALAVLLLASALGQSAFTIAANIFAIALLASPLLDPLFGEYVEMSICLVSIVLLLMFGFTSWRTFLISLLLAALLLVIFFAYSLPIGMFLLVCAFAGIALLIVRLLRRRPFSYLPVDTSTAQYRATLARSLAGIVAVSTLLLMLVTVPTLLLQEHAWLQRDTVLVPKGDELYSPEYLRAFALEKARMQSVTDSWVVGE